MVIRPGARRPQCTADAETSRAARPRGARAPPRRAPAQLGFSLFAYERARGEAMSDVLPLFNIVITIWSTLLVARWRHREATLASAWGVLNREDEAREKQLVEAVEKGAPRAGLGTFVITLPLYALLLGGNVYGMLRIQHLVETAGGTAPAVMQVAFPIVMKLMHSSIAVHGTHFFVADSGIVQHGVNPFFFSTW